MGQHRARPVKTRVEVPEAKDCAGPQSNPGSRIEEGIEQMYDEVLAFKERRPIFWAIAERCVELQRDASKLPDHTPDRKKLHERFRKLEAYGGPALHALPKARQDALILNFALSLITGWIGSRKRRVQTWEDVKYLTDEFAKRIRARPVGNPAQYRHRIAEALEIKLAHPSRTWEEIWEQVSEDLDIPLEDFNRQVQLLRQLLREEGIPIPPQETDN